MKSFKNHNFYTKFTVSILAALFLAALTGCEERSQDIALKFATAMNKADFKTAKTLVTEESTEVFDNLAQFIQTSPNFDENLKKNQQKSFIVSRVEIQEDDTAVVELKDQNGLSHEIVKLVKINKTWKVSLPMRKRSAMPGLEGE